MLKTSRTYQLARKVPSAPNSFYSGAPDTVRIYRTGIGCRSDDLGRFVLAVVLDREDEISERFATPLTSTDGQYWTNGLDGVETIGESILLFDSEDAAVAFSERVWLKALAVYKLRMDEDEKRVWLDVVRRHTVSKVLRAASI